MLLNCNNTRNFIEISIVLHLKYRNIQLAGADPGFFLGGGAPLRNDITDGEAKKKLKASTYFQRRKLHLRGGCAPPAPP